MYYMFNYALTEVVLDLIVESLEEEIQLLPLIIQFSKETKICMC